MVLTPAQNWHDVHDFLTTTGCVGDLKDASEPTDEWLKGCVSKCKKLPKGHRKWIEKGWIKIAFTGISLKTTLVKLPSPSEIRWEFFRIAWFLLRDEKSKALDLLNSFRVSFSLDRLESPSVREEAPQCLAPGNVGVSRSQSPSISYSYFKEIHPTIIISKDPSKGTGGEATTLDMTGTASAYKATLQISGINRDPSPLSELDYGEKDYELNIGTTNGTDFQISRGRTIVTQRKAAIVAEERLKQLFVDFPSDDGPLKQNDSAFKSAKKSTRQNVAPINPRKRKREYFTSKNKYSTNQTNIAPAFEPGATISNPEDDEILSGQSIVVSQLQRSGKGLRAALMTQLGASSLRKPNKRRKICQEESAGTTCSVNPPRDSPGEKAEACKRPKNQWQSLRVKVSTCNDGRAVKMSRFLTSTNTKGEENEHIPRTKRKRHSKEGDRDHSLQDPIQTRKRNRNVTQLQKSKDRQEVMEPLIDSDDTVIPSFETHASLVNSQEFKDSVDSDDTRVFSSPAYHQPLPTPTPQDQNIIPSNMVATSLGSSQLFDGSSLISTCSYEDFVSDNVILSSVIDTGPQEQSIHTLPRGQPLSSLHLDFPTMPSLTPEAVSKGKPPLPRNPYVWAQSRQELCESLNYFRAYQGGVYSRAKYARGYLLDGHPAKCDLWHNDGKIIISHGGGHSATNVETGQTALIKDQSIDSPSCSALRHSWQAKQPVVLIAGDKYNLFPYAMEHSYVVLGYYVIAHAWEEPEPTALGCKGYFVRWKFLFQWVEAQGEPWWSVSSPSVISTDIPTSAHIFNICSNCDSTSPDIYASGWLCTNSHCAKFFLRVKDDSSGAVGYAPSFLATRKQMAYTKLSVDVRPTFIVPELHTAQIVSVKETTTSRIFWKGFWCEGCGRLSCREFWTHWECANCHKQHPIQPIMQRPPPFSAYTGKADIEWLDTAGISCGVRVIRDGKESFRCHSFVLPFSRGTIYFIQIDPSAAATALADKIWYQYQRDAEEVGFFRRYAMKMNKLKGKMLSHYFSQNSGEIYEYVGGTENTVPLDTYSSVKQAMAWIQRRVSMVLGKDPEFNEILSVAYMEDQKMDFHSDGEKDLGPVVTGLSLGSPATMRFRPVPSKWKADGGDGTTRKMPPVVLTLTLRHGDMVIMDGAEIQEYYQHAVYPLGFRIAATARHIQAKKM